MSDATIDGLFVSMFLIIFGLCALFYLAENNSEFHNFIMNIEVNK